MPDFPPDDSQEPNFRSATPSAPDWKSALMDLIAARSAIIRLELAEFRAQSARRASWLALGALAGASGWLLFLAGAVPLLAQALNISWPITALILAAAHLVLLGIFITLARRQTGPAFPATLSEFQKDREWIETLSKTPKS